MHNSHYLYANKKRIEKNATFLSMSDRQHIDINYRKLMYRLGYRLKPELRKSWGCFVKDVYAKRW